ncbi:capsule assembly Wzi family protein [bacterium]|nr:capsule assembly Wzi family protein [bacterium]
MILFKIISKIGLVLIVFIISTVSAQLYIPADPADLLFTEQKIMMGGDDPGSLMVKPVIPHIKQSKDLWSLKVKNEFFYNSGAPNLENTSNIWAGKGISFFTSANFTYNSEYIFASIEPYYFISQNDDYEEPIRVPKFSHLNDNRPHLETPYTSAGIRETQLYLNVNGFGGGFSNANMWWGPGFHSSLMMTSNTTGFGHLMLGTINEKRIKNWGFNGRYILSKFGKKSESEPYYSGYIINATYYSEPIITLGFSRVILSGGNNTEYEISLLEAALLPFEFVKINKLDNHEDALNPVDQTYTGYINLRFPESGLVLFLEYGRNEGPNNFEDFILHPDHSRAFIFGVRKYGLMNNINLMFGVEYANLIQTSFWQLRDTQDWYDVNQFSNYTYDGRYWGAHSGPDSDDFTVYFAYNNKNISIIPTINYERHNVTHPNALVYQNANTLVYDNFLGTYFISEDRAVILDMSNEPEGKIEFKIDLRYLYKGVKFSLNYEYELILNREFRSSELKREKTHSSIIWLNVEKYFTGIFNKKLFSNQKASIY